MSTAFKVLTSFCCSVLSEALQQDSELRLQYDIKILSVLFYQAAIAYSTFMISNAIDLHFLNPLLFFLSILAQPFIYISIFFFFLQYILSATGPKLWMLTDRFESWQSLEMTLSSLL